ncbi:MAG: FAD-dependent oxidoreductase, partial [Hyphomicrobiales bacterium]|nr:FAD-dependent oxidoreductase [Hyphomicrobiales bacterium]
MARVISTSCCVAGGGPAGMMLGYLLARAGVEVLVLEKHADFLRDFRGDTIHPSTLEIIYELGLSDEFLKLPHQKVVTLSAQIGDERITAADFSHLPVHYPFVVFMPQWDFLEFLARQSRRFPHFRLLMRAEAVGLIEEAARIIGVNAATDDGPLEILAELVVGADGRHSTIRRSSGLVVEDLGAPMDVLWFSLPRHPSDPEDTIGRFESGVIFININRGDHWQCGIVIAKGSIEAVHRAGLPAFRAKIGELAPFLSDRTDSIASFDDVKLLTVSVDRLKRWYRDGLLCIGDAAHAMSPVGGVGINLAIQDAVAAANILARPLKLGKTTKADLAAVQKRRLWPTRATQAGQILIQKRVIASLLGAEGPLGAGGGVSAARPPLAARLLTRFPILQRIPARLIGMGVRPEHV